jgi:hypothetical protein
MHAQKCSISIKDELKSFKNLAIYSIARLKIKGAEHKACLRACLKFLLPEKQCFSRSPRIYPVIHPDKFLYTSCAVILNYWFSILALAADTNKYFEGMPVVATV